MIKFLKAALMLSGMIIGAGMFGIPFAFASVGFWVGMAELVILLVVLLALHRMYTDIILSTSSVHRLPGYMRMLLGRRGASVAWFTALFGISGTLLAYILLGSTFLNTIFSGAGNGPGVGGWAIAMGVGGALLTLLPLRKETTINDILTVVLIGFTVVLSFILFGHVDVGNIAGVRLEHAFLPYGVLLFALAGGNVIPDVVQFLGKDRKRARPAVMLGTFIPAVVYALFAFAVVGALGRGVTEDAITGLGAIDGTLLVMLGSVIGFLAVFTSFVILSKSFQALFVFDMHLPRPVAWVIVSVVPLGLYALGVHSFIGVIAAVGAVAVGIDAALIIAAHHTLKKRSRKSHGMFSYVWKAVVYGIVAVGVLFEVRNLFFS